MSDKITLDRETFKVLAADTRIDILKSISSHKKTLTDLASELSISPSTVKEHLDRMVNVGLIYAEDKGMKWKYYKLTEKGKNIVNPSETKVWILLGATFLTIAGSALLLYHKLSTLLNIPGLQEPMLASAPRALAAPSVQEDVAVKASAKAMGYAATELASSVAGANIPYLEIGLVILSAILFGFCIGYLVKRRNTIK